MINWDVSDEQMREIVTRTLVDKRDEMLRQASRAEETFVFKFPVRERRESEACARYSRRQAAHYQQAIDLLSAAPMPGKDEPR